MTKSIAAELSKGMSANLVGAYVRGLMNPCLPGQRYRFSLL